MQKLSPSNPYYYYREIVWSELILSRPIKTDLSSIFLWKLKLTKINIKVSSDDYFLLVRRTSLLVIELCRVPIPVINNTLIHPRKYFLRTRGRVVLDSSSAAAVVSVLAVILRIIRSILYTCIICMWVRCEALRLIEMKLLSVRDWPSPGLFGFIENFRADNLSFLRNCFVVISPGKCHRENIRLDSLAVRALFRTWRRETQVRFPVKTTCVLDVAFIARSSYNLNIILLILDD